jgi:hypothetical protein
VTWWARRRAYPGRTMSSQIGFRVSATRVVVILSLLAIAACNDSRQSVQRADPPYKKTMPGSDADDARMRAAQPAAASPSEKPQVRVIAHPQNPMVLYVTDLPSEEQRVFFGIPVGPRPAVAWKVFVVDVRTREWRELDFAEDVKKKFSLNERPVITFEVAGSSRLSVLPRE